MNIQVAQLIEDSQKGNVEWCLTSDPFTFEAEYRGAIFTINATPEDMENKTASLCSWNDKAESNHISETEEDRRQCYQLLQIIFRLNGCFKMNYIKYSNKMEKQIGTISLFKIRKRLGYETENTHPLIHLKESDYFYYSSKDDSKYVEPIMKQLETFNGFTPYNEANIILISAPGATGKTAMADYLSKTLRIPILNLSSYDAVGANSIGGLIMKELDENDIFAYHNGLKNGTCSMIIDGLDEASIRITHESFEAFMKDVAFFSRDAKGLPFVILGRPAVMENAAFALEENNVKTTLLQIEPFTIEKAKEFIDVQTDGKGKLRYDQQYREVRDYIIDEIGGFFKKESDINNLVFERFIGYAPVLVSIKTLLSIETNYFNLLQELQNDKKQKIELLVDVVEKIMDRERKKIHEEVLEQFFDKNRDEAYKNSIMERCGTNQEQCCRMIDYLLGEESIFPLFNDENLDAQYNQKINEWIENHPFVSTSERWFENIVFESYVLAYLSCLPAYKSKAIRAMKTKNSCSYLFLYLFDTISKSKEIPIEMIPYMINSFKAMDRPHDIGMIEILPCDDENSDVVNYCMNFGREGTSNEYEFYFHAHTTDEIELPSPLSSMNIDIPLGVRVSGINTEFQTPLSIHCRKFILSSKEVLFSDSQQSTDLLLESEEIDLFAPDGSPAILTNRIQDAANIRIITSSILPYPFSEYRVAPEAKYLDNETLTEAFTKFRRMILMFRSHSKGVLARYCSKIDNRIKKTEIGRCIIAKLLKERVIWSDNVYYYIDYERFASIIGVKYDDIRSCIINEKTRTFLVDVVKTQNQRK